MAQMAIPSDQRLRSGLMPGPDRLILLDRRGLPLDSATVDNSWQRRGRELGTHRGHKLQGSAEQSSVHLPSLARSGRNRAPTFNAQTHILGKPCRLVTGCLGLSQRSGAVA